MEQRPLDYQGPARPVLQSDGEKVLDARRKYLLAAVLCTAVATCDFCFMPFWAALLTGPVLSVAAAALALLAFKANRRFVVALLIANTAQLGFYACVALSYLR